MAGDREAYSVSAMLTSSAPSSPKTSARLLELVYDQLHRLAKHRMASESKGHTLQATALVHEAYARLVGNAEIAWQGKAHFFAVAAEAMRRILVDHARAKGRLKRGGDRGSGGTRRRVPLAVLDLAAAEEPEEILAVDKAFGRLQEMDPDLARVVQLRFFAGLTEQETAQAMGVSERTIRRDWTVARAWLRRWLDEHAGAPAD
jgi:RNA polymerase sigma factor (TIGR02999 family)